MELQGKTHPEPTNPLVHQPMLCLLSREKKKNMRDNQEIIMQQQEMQQPTFKTGWNSQNGIASKSMFLIGRVLLTHQSTSTRPVNLSNIWLGKEEE